jgi:protein-tyrosine phosphatase
LILRLILQALFDFLNHGINSYSRKIDRNRSDNINRFEMASVLFVCSANRFRSPIAAAIFSKKLAVEGKASQWEVGSAGTWTLPNLKVFPDIIRLAFEMDLDLNNHLTRPIDMTILSKSDLVLVMEAGQKEAIVVEFPSIRRRVFLFSEVAEGIVYDIPDPFINDKYNPKEIAIEIQDLIEKGYQNICELANNLAAQTSHHSPTPQE